MSDFFTCEIKDCILASRPGWKIDGIFLCADHYAEFKPIADLINGQWLNKEITQLRDFYEQALKDCKTKCAQELANERKICNEIFQDLSNTE